MILFYFDLLLIQFDSIQQLALYDDPVLVNVTSSCNPDEAYYWRICFCTHLQQFEYSFRWSNNNDLYVLMLMLMLMMMMMMMMMMRSTSIALVSILVNQTQVHLIQFKFHHNDDDITQFWLLILMLFSASKIPFDSSPLSCCYFELIDDISSIAPTVTFTGAFISSPFIFLFDTTGLWLGRVCVRLLPLSSIIDESVHPSMLVIHWKHSPSCSCFCRVLVLLLIFYWVLGSCWYFLITIHDCIILYLFWNLFGGLSLQGFCSLGLQLLYLHVHYYCCTSVLCYIVLWYIKSVKLCLSFHPKF